MIKLHTNASVVVLTGAGISAESGIQTFRAADGLWCGHRVEDVATPEAFIRNPSLVHEFYNMRRRQLLSPDITPNAAHAALAKLEQEWPGRVHVITQNIDNLHERAGTKNLIHMHGELLKMFCMHCAQKHDLRDDLSAARPCPACGRANTLRPDIVWFGEIPYDMDRIYDLLADCDVFLSVGTSGNVYPAAGFVQTARMGGAHTIELNLEATQIASAFDQHIHGPATQTLPQVVASLLREVL